MTRKSLYLTFALMLCVLASASTVGLLPGSQPRAEGAADIQKNLKIVSHNVEKKGFGAGYGRIGYPGNAIESALKEAEAPGTVAVLLQEVCEDQFRKLQQLGAGKWTVSWRALGIPGVPDSCGAPIDGRPAFIGDIAIWLKGDDAEAYQIPLYSDQYDPAALKYGSGLACVKGTQFATTFRICSTHLPAEADENRRLVGRIKNQTAPWIDANNAVAVGGDFNVPRANSDALDPMYEQGGGGSFSEADAFHVDSSKPTRAGLQQGQLTGKARCKGSNGEYAVQKRDYIFFSSNRVPLNRSRGLTVSEKTRSDADQDCGAEIAAGRDTPSDRRSDHYLLFGRFNVSVNAE